MKCLQCGGEHENEADKCPACAPPNQAIKLVTPDKREPDQTRPDISSKSVGICPDCGTEQVGKVYRISPGMADFLRVKSSETFLPDKHCCIRRVIAR